MSIYYTGIEYKSCQAPRNWKFRPGNRAFREYGTAETEQFGGTPAGVLARFASLLNKFLLLDQAAKIRLVHEPSGERLNTALQLQ